MRKPDWPQLLTDYLQQQKNEPFIWGINDCCHFAATAAEIITGTGYGRLYPCNTAMQASRLLAQHGGVGGIADKHYTRIQPEQAQRGDMVEAFVDAGHSALGICNGTDAFFRAADGLARIPMDQCVAAWRVE